MISKIAVMCLSLLSDLRTFSIRNSVQLMACRTAHCATMFPIAKAYYVIFDVALANFVINIID